MAALGEQLFRRKPIVIQQKHHKGEELARNIGTFQLMMFGVGATVGTGIFFVLSESIPEAGPAVIISVIVAAICAGLSALCYAELASAIPVSGSTYSYTYHALGEIWAVIIAGCVLLEYGVAVSEMSADGTSMSATTERCRRQEPTPESTSVPWLNVMVRLAALVMPLG